MFRTKNLMLIAFAFLMLAISCKKEYIEPIVQNKGVINPLGLIKKSLSSNVIDGKGVTDIDGNVYQTIVIGNQEWMIENLRVTKYTNGEPITRINDDTDSIWPKLKTGAFCYFNCDTTYKYHGALYNCFAVNKGIAPNGWHVPTIDDYQTLKNYCDSAKVKYSSVTYSGLMRWGGFGFNPDYDHWWTSATVTPDGQGVGCAMSYIDGNITWFGNEGWIGFGVTCVKNN